MKTPRIPSPPPDRSHATLASVRTRARQCGATVEENEGGRFRDFCICSPVGWRWSCDGIHMLVMRYPDARDRAARDERLDALFDAMQRMFFGLEPCDDPECEYCHQDAEGGVQ